MHNLVGARGTSTDEQFDSDFVDVCLSKVLVVHHQTSENAYQVNIFGLIMKLAESVIGLVEVLVILLESYGL